MTTTHNTSIKQEIADRSIAGSSSKPIEINEDEESSDGENSVIILDSDTEPDDVAADDDEAMDEEDSDEEDEDEEESEEDSDSSVDSESVNSVWSTVDEAVGDKITTEAAEMNIVKKFEKAIYAIADKDAERGKRILEKLLEDPIISSYQVEDLDYETIEEPPRYARMLQVFIASHKNLAKLDSDSEVAHLCQVLAYEPNNTAVWFDVAMKSVETGDLNFAKYAFKKCESLRESLEAHATVLYLTCDYGSCLQVLKTFQDETDELNDKMKYLKFKIRATSQYYKQLSDRIFEEDEVYAEINALDQRKIIVFDERMDELRSRSEKKRAEIEDNCEKEQQTLSVIPISISADLDLRTVCTLFCDLFDRIHAHSFPRDQFIDFTEWESRKDYTDVVETLAKVVDIVECIEEMTEKVDEESRKRKGKRKVQKKEYLANWRKRLFVERGSEEIDSEANTTADEEDGDTQDEVEEIQKNGIPENELATSFGLVCEVIEPIRSGTRRKENTPPPSDPQEFVDCDAILDELQSSFSDGSHTILEILEATLLLIVEHSPKRGAIPESLREVIREMYNRLEIFEPTNVAKFEELNVAVMELDCRKATVTCIKKYISFVGKSDNEENGANQRSLVLRFMWKYSQTGLRDDIRLEYLYALQECLRPGEVVPITSGSFATWDVDLSIGELEKKKRIESVKHLWKSRNYRDLVEIIEKDIEFGAISNEETLEMLTFWLQSLEKLKLHKDLCALAARALHFYLFTEFELDSPNKLENLVESLLMKMHRVDFTKIGKTRASTIGYLMCVAMKKYKRLEKEWKNWKIMFEVVRETREGSRVEYIETLDRNVEPHAMPLLEMDLLVKAHEVLGEHHCCAQKNYEFLFYVIDRIRDIIDDIPTLELIYMKDNGWLWNNMNEELGQILFCLYGKYGKKRKSGEDHENGGSASTSLETARKVLSVILVQPLPLYDEKEKLSHDIVELLNSKFPKLLQILPEKKKNLDEFSKILRVSKSLEEVNEGLKKCRDDSDDYIQSLVWYAMALSSYRSTSHKDAAKYSELYLLCGESAHDDRLRGSVWGMLAHENVHDLFQLDLHEIYEQWKWRILPFRMAIDAQQHEPVPHFELAAIIYQLATSLSRFYRYLSKTDPRRSDMSDVSKLRIEAREQFDKSLELTRLGEDGSQPEHQWLCYFFVGKLEAKFGKWDIVKVVESFYEAACGCELAGFYYPQKVQTKKQTNFEPLEVHYQAHSAVYKYILNCENPTLEVLRKLRILLKLMNDGHKVVKPSNSLFRVSPDVYSVMDGLVFATMGDEIKEEGVKKEIIEELKEMCFKAFTLITERFPHIKSYYRLAQMEFEKGALDTASEHIFKNVFKRKKRDDGMFDNVVEISCNDINRNGSFNFHIERCIKLGVQIAFRQLDLHNVVAMLVTMIGIIGKDDEEHVPKELWKTVVTLNMTAMENIVMSKDNSSARSTPSPNFGEGIVKKHKTPHLTKASLRNEIWRLWTVLSKCAKPNEELIRLVKAKTEVLIVHAFRSVQELRLRMTTNADGSAKRKYNVQKRKLDFIDMAQPLLKRAAELNAEAALVAAPKPSTSTAVGPYQPLSDSDDEIQVLPPPPKKAAVLPPTQPVIPKPVVAPKPVAPKPVAPKPAVPKPAATGTVDPSILNQFLLAVSNGNQNNQLVLQALSSLGAFQMPTSSTSTSALPKASPLKPTASASMPTLTSAKSVPVKPVVKPVAKPTTSSVALKPLPKPTPAPSTSSAVLKPVPKPTASVPKPVGRPPVLKPAVTSRPSVATAPQPRANVPTARATDTVVLANQLLALAAAQHAQQTAAAAAARQVRPSPVRPAASTSAAASSSSSVIAANMMQYLNNITDPVQKARAYQQLFGNK